MTVGEADLQKSIATIDETVQRMDRQYQDREQATAEEVQILEKKIEQLHHCRSNQATG